MAVIAIARAPRRRTGRRDPLPPFEGGGAEGLGLALGVGQGGRRGRAQDRRHQDGGLLTTGVDVSEDRQS
jgi:hypothetical protein